MNLPRKVSIILLAAGLAVLDGKGNAQTPESDLQAARSGLKGDRKAIVAEAMQITEQEGKTFWPLYQQSVAVRPDVDLSKRKVGDKVVIRTTEALAIRVVKP